MLEKFRRQNPDHVDALASLGYVAIEHGRLEEAEAPLNARSVFSRITCPCFYDYARLALKRRDYEEAAARLQRVVLKDRRTRQAHYQLFLAYSRLKQPEKRRLNLAEFKRLKLLRKVRQNVISREAAHTAMLGQSQMQGV